MIVDEPHITVDGDEVTVAASLTTETAVAKQSREGTFPPTLYFAFPRAYAEFVTRRSDAFATALLPLAMRRGERLHLRGELSCRLAQGLREYQRIQTTWKPGFFTAVPLEFDRVTDGPPGDGEGAVGSAFSGGVDSFHTLWTHLPANEEYGPYALTHCLLINGFDEDTDLEGTGKFRALQHAYETMLAELGVALVVARTNLRQFIDPWVLKQGFAASVIAPALAVGRLFKRLYLPSSYKFTLLGLFPDGSHPMLDHLLSTETMETIHDGAHLTRVEKTIAISRWPATFDHLRVCFGATGIQPVTGAIDNCCACEKCVRTMATLDLAGALGDYACFPEPLSRRSIRRLDYRWPGSRIFAREIIRHARSIGRKDVARDFRRAIVVSATLRTWATKLVHASAVGERRSRPYAALLRLPKRAIKRCGWGRGWLY